MAKKRNRKNRTFPAPTLTQHTHVKRNGSLIKAREMAIFFSFATLVFLIYSNTFRSPLIFDDLHNIQDNPHIRLTRLTLEGITRAGLESPSSNRPVANVSFALNYYFHQYNVAGYHLVNILIHVTTGILLYLFLKTTLNLPSQRAKDQIYAWVPFLTVLIWLVHPIQTHSVTYIIQRMNSLATMLYILSLLLYAKARLFEKPGLRALLFAGCILAGLLGLGSKQTTATLPMFIFLYEWYFFQELSRAWLKRHALPLVGALISFFVLTLIFLGLNPLEQILASYDYRDFTPGQRVLTQFRVIIFYISLLIFPHPSRLNLDRDFALSYSPYNPITTLFSMAVISGLIVLAIFSAKRQRLMSFSILWFFGNLIIESSVIGLEIIFDHRTYLPSMFVVLMAVLLVHRYVRPKIIGLIFLGAVVMVFSHWTHDRNSTWHDEVTLWRDCVQKSPNKARPHNNLGVYLIKRGNIEEAMRHYSEALRIKPDYADAYNNMGDALARQGKLKEAVHHFSVALRINPKLVKAHFGMGRASQRLGRLNEAIHHFSEATRIKPDYHQAHYFLGNALHKQGKMNEVIRHFLRAIQIKPDYAAAHNNLGIVLASQGKLHEGIRHFSEAVRLKPHDADYHFNMANALADLGKHQEAIDHYSKAVQMNPFDAELQETLKRAKRTMTESDNN